jgi:hypothetical protein
MLRLPSDGPRLQAGSGVQCAAQVRANGYQSRTQLCVVRLYRREQRAQRLVLILGRPEAAAKLAAIRRAKHR